MATCSLCGKEDLCFTCPYCNGVYCAEHRLPESHGCPGLQLARDHARRKIADAFMGMEYEDEERETIVKPKLKQKKLRKPKRTRFSKTEIRHLLISSILVILVTISLMGGSPLGVIRGVQIILLALQLGYWWYPVILIGLFLFSFLIHEFAHKFTAQHYGLWSEFRMTAQGYYLSAIAILFAFPIFGTGVMYSSGTRSLEEDGKINLAGPASNLVIAAALSTIAAILIVLGIVVADPIRLTLSFGIQLNAILGLFNLIPIPPFDGVTVFRWKRSIWIVVFALLAVFLFCGYYVIPVFL